ncbi:E3 ubiquitin-protein ligase rififylin isoform X1 [Esox lucius]|uniref:RING-type domain-containing protein n=1 Tax=Esox lucius TaxID=8010 RepID=A0A3P8YED3_ESOLU|nr:E3 ubiquitin-protein ligase rififylin isoform X1 [Esox lucius]XP_010891850.1 E3 ubiquitin-protein ligase rififylin isoform X1 [Esox lucius]
MWTSCCSWPCLEPTATVEENGRSWRQAYTNSGYSQSLTSPEHLCKACGGHFDAIARKHVCVDCKKNFCGHCSVQLEPPHPRLCHTCQRFHRTLFDRAQLMRLKVRELRDYLHLHEVPTQTCREKEELVELVLGQQTPSTSSSSETVSTQPGAHNSLPAPGPPPSPQTPGPASPDTLTTDQPEQLAPEAEPESEQISDEEDDDEDEEDEAEESSGSEETLIPDRRASLSDLSCVEDIGGLSVRQLKEILARNFVNYKGCCEKWELMERVTRLYNDQKDLQNLVSNAKHEEDPAAPKSQEVNLCRICMDSPIDCVLLECGHMVTCSKCGKRMSECPICRQYVVRAVHVFRS